MARNQVPLEFESALAMGDTSSEIPEPECAVGRFFEDAKLACAFGGDRHLRNFRAETQDLDKNTADTYKAIAARAAAAELQKTQAQDEWESEVTADPLRLEKRFASGLNLDGYRNWFRGELAKGKSAQQALDDWLAANPGHTEAVANALAAVAAEF